MSVLDDALVREVVEKSGWSVEAVESLSFPRQNISALTESCFRMCHSLKYLNLARNAISDASPLRHLSCCEEISLYFNALSDAASATVPLSSLRTLRILDLRMNPLTQADDYRLSVLFRMQQLERLDERDVAPQEIRRARIKFGHLNDAARSDAGSAPPPALPPASPAAAAAAPAADATKELIASIEEDLRLPEEEAAPVPTSPLQSPRARAARDPVGAELPLLREVLEALRSVEEGARSDRSRAAAVLGTLAEAHHALLASNRALREELDAWKARYERDSAAWRDNFEDLRRLYVDLRGEEPAR